jgi:hypothetical protein
VKQIPYLGCGSLFLCSARTAHEAEAVHKPKIMLCITRGQAPSSMVLWQHHSHDASGQPNRLIESLSPSWVILNKYNSSRRDEMAWKEYVYGWHLEKDESHTYNRSIARICDHLQAGKNVVLGCFCPSESRCHRFLVAEAVEIEMTKRLSQ